MTTVLTANRFASSVADLAPPTAPVSLRPNLRASMIDGAAYGSMVGMGETYLAAFVLAMGLGEVTAGLVTTLPMVVGGFVQLVSPYAVRRLGSYKVWVVACATLQALAFVPLIIAAFWGQLHMLTAVIAAAIYWGSGMATGAAWNAWIGTLVPKRIRSRFFSLRTRTSQIMVFGGFLSGGILLQATAETNWIRYSFGLLFSLAVLSRLISVFNLVRQTERRSCVAQMNCYPLHRLFQRVLQGSGRLIVYLVCVQAAVQISGPFFASFLLGKLEFGYGNYVLLLSLSYLSKIIAFPILGRVGKVVGAYRLLWLGGLGIVPASGLWIFSQNVVWIGTLQIASGFFWAAYELGFFLLFFDAFDERERTSILTLYNFLNTVAWVSGALVGGVILHYMQASTTGYFVLFALSSLGRAGALILLARVPCHAVPAAPVGLRTVNVRLGAASSDVPVIPSLPAPTLEETQAA